MISSEQFKFEGAPPVRKQRVDRLKSLLKDEQVEYFIRALEQLTNPDHYFRDWCKDTVISDTPCCVEFISIAGRGAVECGASRPSSSDRGI